MGEGVIEVSEVAAPTTPSTGKVKLYAKAAGTLFSKDDAGTETDYANAPPSGTAGGDLGGTYPNPTVDDGADSTAIHDNVASEISAITEKVTPVSGDFVIIEDSAASNVKKRVQIGNLPGGDDLGDHEATQNIDLNTFKLVGNNGSAGIEIDSSGNVGIGTASPDRLLHLKQTASGEPLSLESTTTFVGMKYLVDGKTWALYNTLGIANQGFGLWDQNNSVYRIAVDGTSGEVGMGTTDPSATLHVAGTVDRIQCRVQGNSTQTSDIFVVENSGGTDQFSVDNTGTILINGDINHDGSNIGFFGTAPAAQAAAYTPSNVSTDRAYDANSTTVAELADVLGTLIADLKTYGLLQ